METNEKVVFEKLPQNITDSKSAEIVAKSSGSHPDYTENDHYDDVLEISTVSKTASKYENKDGRNQNATGNSSYHSHMRS